MSVLSLGGGSIRVQRNQRRETRSLRNRLEEEERQRRWWASWEDVYAVDIKWLNLPLNFIVQIGFVKKLPINPIFLLPLLPLLPITGILILADYQLLNKHYMAQMCNVLGTQRWPMLGSALHFTNPHVLYISQTNSLLYQHPIIT